MKTSKVYYKRSNRLIWKKIRQEFIVIDPDIDNYYILNETGETIFKFLYKKRGLKEIIRKIIDEFAVSENKASKDTKNFLRNCLKNNLIQMSNLK